MNDTITQEIDDEDDIDIIPDIRKIKFGGMTLHDFEQHPEYAFKRFGILDKICRWLTSEDPRILYEWDHYFECYFADIVEDIQEVLDDVKNDKPSE